MKKLAVILLLMFLPVLVLGQDADELERKFQRMMDDLKQKQQTMESELLYQKNIMEMDLRYEMRLIELRLLTESIVYDSYCPTYMWELVERPYLYLPSSASRFPTPDMAASNTIVFPKSVSTSPLKPVTHPIATPPVATIPVVTLVYSGRKRPVIPVQSGHLFRFKAATDSG